MKIIKEGIVRRPTPPWFLGQHVCPCCGAIYEIEPGDEAQISVQTEKRPGGRSWALVVCPFCSCEHKIERHGGGEILTGWRP